MGEHKVSGLPADDSYLECSLPPFLLEAIAAMQSAWEKLDYGEECPHWDCYYAELQSALYMAEAEQVINSEQAWHLSDKSRSIARA